MGLASTCPPCPHPSTPAICTSRESLFSSDLLRHLLRRAPRINWRPLHRNEGSLGYSGLGAQPCFPWEMPARVTLAGGKHEAAGMEQTKDYKSQVLITTKISCNQLQGDPKGISELLEKGGHEIARDPGQQYYKKP